MKHDKPYRTVDYYTDEQKPTAGMTLRQAANKAGISCVLGFESIYLNGTSTRYRDARAIIGRKLLNH